jgi:hypothetical protein
MPSIYTPVQTATFGRLLYVYRQGSIKEQFHESGRLLHSATCSRASEGATVQPTTQPTKCDVLHDFRVLWQSPRSVKSLENLVHLHSHGGSRRFKSYCAHHFFSWACTESNPESPTHKSTHSRVLTGSPPRPSAILSGMRPAPPVFHHRRPGCRYPGSFECVSGAGIVCTVFGSTLALFTNQWLRLCLIL